MNPPQNLSGSKRPYSNIDISSIEDKINVLENDITFINNKINEKEIEKNEINKMIKVDQSNERLHLLLLIEKKKQLTITTERLYEKEKLLQKVKEQKLAYELGKYYGDQLVLRNCSKSNQLVLFITADIVVNSCYS